MNVLKLVHRNSSRVRVPTETRRVPTETRRAPWRRAGPRGSYVPVVETEVLAGVGEAEVRRTAPGVHDGQRHGQQASPQEVGLFVHGRQLPHHHCFVVRKISAGPPLHVGGDLTFQLIPAVLEPDLHLSFCQLEGAGEAGSLRAAQIAFHVKGRLQLEDLSLGEDGARLLLCDYLAVLVGAAAVLLEERGGGGGGGGAAVVAAAVPAAVEAPVGRLLRLFPVDSGAFRRRYAVGERV